MATDHAPVLHEKFMDALEEDGPHGQRVKRLTGLLWNCTHTADPDFLTHLWGMPVGSTYAQVARDVRGFIREEEQERTEQMRAERAAHSLRVGLNVTQPVEVLRRVFYLLPHDLRITAKPA